MRKNAFTLIELLAVIVILAIVALIATPIILGIIRDAKEESNKRSAENYIDAVEQAIVRENMKGIFRPTECDIVDGKVTCDGIPLDVDIDGEVPIGGTIYIDNGKVAPNTTLKYKNGDNPYINEKGELVFDKIETKEEGPEHLAQDNVRPVTTPTTGIVPVVEDGNIKPGSEFKIKVSDNIKTENDEIVEYTFFVLSNDGDYVNLIAEQNVTPTGLFTSEPQTGDEWYVTESSSYDNRYGPQTAYTYLSNATSNWTNIPIIESFSYEDEGYKSNSNYGYQNIITALNEETYITTITPYSSDYGDPVLYQNMRARLPKYSEITTTEVGCTSSNGSCPIWMVNYLYSNSTSEQYYNQTNGKVNSIKTNYGYWLLSSYPGYSRNARRVYCTGNAAQENNTNYSYLGIRPVITVLKSDLLRVM